ncbi:putative dehydrin [Medicago truncatula]|uniref:Dehydrin n=1 Tax=Medicago truncatula TaxID=3880 RepID=G7LCC2_MEDTR|nr:dehydrin [Medicago truncatula]RHN43849.1 putative dehydrin [Medicago truncatula]
MDNFQNQYGAVPISNNDLIHRELDTTGVVDGGGSTQAMADTTTAVDTTTTDDGVFVDGNKTNNHHNKKGIIDKIKEKLPGTHHHK